MNIDISGIGESGLKVSESRSKPIVNFFENSSEDLSILRDIISERSQININDISKISIKNPHVMLNQSKFSLNRFKEGESHNVADKSTDMILTQGSKDR